VFLAGLLCLAGCADDGTWFKPKMPQLKVVLAAGCPGSLGPAGDVANVLPSGSTLVPEGAVDGALICLYGKEAASGVGPAPLKKQVRLSAPDATRLKTAVAGVALKGPEGPVACPCGPARRGGHHRLSFRSGWGCQWPIVCAHGRPAKMPAGGHENCPLMAMRSAHQVFGGVGHVGLWF